MTPEAMLDQSAVVAGLLRRSRQGALATLMRDSGEPYCSLVNVASDVDGAPILLISRLAVHTRNIIGDARVSLMLDERAPGDPLEGARISLQGTAVAADTASAPRLRARYLNAHPSAAQFAGFGDFSFYRINPSTVHLVAGFGRIVDLSPGEFLIDLTGCETLIDAEREAIDHMNADHADALLLYATILLGAAPAAWRCSGIDPQGLDLTDGVSTLRLLFAQIVRDPAALRKELKTFADSARRQAKLL